MAKSDASSGFEIREILNQTFVVVGRNFVPLALVALILCVLPSNLVIWATRALRPVHSAGFAASIIGMGVSLASASLSAAAGSVGAGALCLMAFSALNGEDVDLAKQVPVAIGFAAPLVILSLIKGVSTWIGYILFVVPGCILNAMWIVAIPDLIVRKKTLLSPLNRSAELTKGRRWAIFGVTVIYGAIVLVGAEALNAVAKQFPLTRDVTGPGHLALYAPLTMLSAMFSAVGSTVIYYELVRVQGDFNAAVAATFD